MDGFYVAKIQKLSDKLPEDTVEEEPEAFDKEKVASKVEKGEKKATEGMKRKSEEEQKTEKRSKKRSKISIPPSVAFPARRGSKGQKVPTNPTQVGKKKRQTAKA